MVLKQQQALKKNEMIKFQNDKGIIELNELKTLALVICMSP